jgi:hypothetical protein
MQVLRDIAPYLALAACAAAVALAALLAVTWRGLRKLRRAQTVVLGHHEERDLVAHAEHVDGRVQNLREAVEILTDTLDVHKQHLDEALTNRAVVRYDAFRDAGGEQSASIALLDNHASGLVISTISARDFARLYVKLLDHGTPDRELSPEEARCVALAVPKPLLIDTPAPPLVPRVAEPVAEPGVPPVVGRRSETPATAADEPAGGREPGQDKASWRPAEPSPGGADAAPPHLPPDETAAPGPRQGRERAYESWFDTDEAGAAAGAEPAGERPDETAGEPPETNEPFPPDVR